MISIWYTDYGKGKRLVVQGHASPAECKINAVCAAVTALVACIGSNVEYDFALGYIRSKMVCMVNGNADIKMIPTADKMDDCLLWFDRMVYGLRLMAEQYPDDIKFIA